MRETKLEKVNNLFIESVKKPGSFDLQRPLSQPRFVHGASARCLYQGSTAH